MKSVRTSVEYACDASDLAYAAVVYLHTLHSIGEVDTNLIASKTQVAPIKKQTTVEPLLSGHPWGMARWPFNRGGHLMEVCPIWTRIWSNFLVFTYKSLFIMYKSKMSTSIENSLKQKTVPNKTKKIF